MNLRLLALVWFSINDWWNLSHRYLKFSPSLSKTFTNCFIKTKLICKGGGEAFWIYYSCMQNVFLNDSINFCSHSTINFFCYLWNPICCFKWLLLKPLCCITLTCQLKLVRLKYLIICKTSLTVSRFDSRSQNSYYVTIHPKEAVSR